MTEATKRPAKRTDNETPLESWKEIASHLNRTVRTVRRWEKEENLPVRRHQHQVGSSVYAFRSELDAWWAARQPRVQRAAPLAMPWRRPGPALGFALVLWLALVSVGNPGSILPVSTAAAQGQTGATLTQIFVGVKEADPGGRFSPDGQYFAGTDWNTGNLTVREVESGKVRALTDTNWLKLPAAFALSPVWSPDGSRLAYSWMTPDGTFELRILSPAGGAPGVLFTSKEESFFPSDWSPDGKMILGFVVAKDRRRIIATVSTAGTRTDLRALNADNPHGVRFSPDGQFVVYAATVGGKREVYLLSLEQRTETKLTHHPSEDDEPIWSPDGRYLLYRSDRSGRWDLWAQPFREGQPAGEARVVSPDIGEVLAFLGWLPGGQLTYTKRVSFGTLYAVSLQASSGTVLGKPRTPILHFLGQHMRALWSPDGNRIAFLASSGARGKLYLATDDSQQVRPLSTRPLIWVRLAGWYPEGDAVVLSGMSPEGVGIYRLALTDGSLQTIYEDPQMMWPTGRLSPQATSVSYFRKGEKGSELCVYDLKHRKMLRVVELQPQESYYGAEWSPDGKALFYLSYLGDQHARIVRVPLPRGEPQVILTSEKGLINHLGVSPDGQYLAYIEYPRQATGKLAEAAKLWLVSAGGGQPKRIRLPKGHRPTRVTWTPDGKQLAYVSLRAEHQFWRLSDFLPIRDELSRQASEER